MYKRRVFILGLCALGVGAMSRKGDVAMRRIYLHCPPQPGVAEDFRKAACEALAKELAQLRGQNPVIREGGDFGAENGLHIRLNLATKGRHFINGKLDWQRVEAGKPAPVQSGPLIEGSTMDRETNVTSFIHLGRTLARHGGLPQ